MSVPRQSSIREFELTFRFKMLHNRERLATKRGGSNLEDAMSCLKRRKDQIYRDSRMMREDNEASRRWAILTNDGKESEIFDSMCKEYEQQFSAVVGYSRPMIHMFEIGNSDLLQLHLSRGKDATLSRIFEVAELEQAIVREEIRLAGQRVPCTEQGAVENNCAVSVTRAAGERMPTSVGGFSFLNPSRKSAVELVSQILLMAVDRVVRSHDNEFPMAMRNSLFHQQALRILGRTFPAYKVEMLANCFRARYQVRAASDFGVVDVLECLDPNMRQHGEVLQLLMSSALACHWTRTVQYLWERVGVPFACGDAFHALSGGSACLVRILRMIKKREQEQLTMMVGGPAGMEYPRTPVLYMVTPPLGFHTQKRRGESDGAEGGGQGPSSSGDSDPGQDSSQLRTILSANQDVERLTLHAEKPSLTIFHKIYDILRDGMWFKEQGWFTSDGAPCELVRTLKAYGVDLLGLRGHDGIAPRSYLETVAIPGMLRCLKNVRVSERHVNDRLVMGARFMWALCEELYALECDEWRARATVLLMASTMPAQKTRIGKNNQIVTEPGHCWLACLDAGCLAMLVRDYVPRPEQPDVVLGATVRALRILAKPEVLLPNGAIY